MRPEPRTAQYYSGEKNFIDDLLVQLKNSYGIVLLPRDEIQKEFYKQDRFAGIFVLEEPISLTDVMSNCDLFIGAGGTMTREAAVLGIPTVSVYQDELLQVDEYLIKMGLMVHSKNPSAEFIISFLEQSGKKLPDRQLLDKGKQAYELIKSTLLALTMDKHKTTDREFEKENQPNA